VRYTEYVDAFSKDTAETLALHRPIDHAIDLESSFNTPEGPIYNLSEVQLNTLKAYIESNRANGFIQGSSSPAAAPIILAIKKDRCLRLSVDYKLSIEPLVKYR